MVICCFFPGIYSDPLFPRVLSTSGGQVTSMRVFLSRDFGERTGTECSVPPEKHRHI